MEIGAVPHGHFNHISLVVMTFKCHTGLDTCVTTTPGASPYTSLYEQKSLLFFSIPEQSTMISGEQKRAGMSTKEPPKAEQWKESLLPNLHLCFSCRPTFFSWQMIWIGRDHAVPNPSHLAEDHTDGPDWASWTHRQLGVMMHRMLPINRMYCRAEASQADTPDRATEGGTAKTPQKTWSREGGATVGSAICRTAEVGNWEKGNWRRFICV